MIDLSLSAAQTIVSVALATARERDFKPLAVIVLDGRGTLKAAAVEDGAPLMRADIAHGKAYGAVAFGAPSRTLELRAKERPHFLQSISTLVGGKLVPVPGGVLIRSSTGAIIGAVGVSGDTSDHDEIAAASGIVAAGLAADPDPSA